MKKLRLKALELGAREVLSRAQLKNVLGGSGSGDPGTVTCTKTCDCGSGRQVDAKLIGCVKDTCATDSTSVSCTKDSGTVYLHVKTLAN